MIEKEAVIDNLQLQLREFEQKTKLQDELEIKQLDSAKTILALETDLDDYQKKMAEFGVHCFILIRTFFFKLIRINRINSTI